MSNNILFVFEGSYPEEQIVSGLQKFFLQDHAIIKCVFGAEIYQIYSQIKDDNDLDTFTLIKERNIENAAILEGYSRSDFAEIYLFFDFDGHSSKANDDNLLELLKFFNEETDKGKLYLSYPMAESIKHIENIETFRDLTVECRKNIRYKNLVSENCLKHLNQINKYDLSLWKQIVLLHLMKMNFVVENSYSLPNSLYSQDVIFYFQREKYIRVNSAIAVLSAFPIFIHDYFGNATSIKMVK
jgi:hypothetical protein